VGGDEEEVKKGSEKITNHGIINRSELAGC